MTVRPAPPSRVFRPLRPRSLFRLFPLPRRRAVLPRSLFPLVVLGCACLLFLARPARTESLPRPELTATETQFLAAHPVLRVGVGSQTMPFQDVETGPDGRPRYVGLAADYLARLGEMLGVTFEPRYGVSLTRALELAQSGEIDLFPCLARTPQREAFLHFTRPYVALPFVLVTRREPEAPSDLGDLEGKVLTVAPTYYAYDRLMHDQTQHGIHFLFAENGPAALRQVSDEQADATILNLAMVTTVIARQDLDNLRIATPLPWPPNTLAMASPSPMLAGIVQKALDAIPEATREAMLAQALKQPPPRQHGLPPIGWAVLAVCVLPWPGVLALRWWRRRAAREAQQAAMAQELRSQRELMEAVFNATSDAIIVLDDAYHVLMTNRVGAERFGQDVASMLGQGILDLTEKPVAETRRQRYGQALHTGETVRFTDVRAGRTYDNILQPLRIGDGGTPRLAIYARDITEQRAIEAALRENQERLDKIFRLIPVVVTLTSLVDGRYLEVNDAFTTISGYTRDEVLGRNSSELEFWTHPNDREAIYGAIDREGVVRNLELRLRLKGDRLATGLLSATTLEAYGQPCLLAVIVDISARKAMEEVLRLAKDSAEAANQAKSRFLSTMSHEIRTPMNTILGMVDVLRGTPLSDRQLEFLRTLEVAGEALMSLLTDILELSKIESGTMRMARVPYDPAEVLRQAEAMLHPQAEAKGLALLTQAGPDLPHEAHGDPGRLRQILVNLLGNAVKFTPRGEIRAAVRCQEGHGGRPELLYTVTDTGIGIEPDKQQSIFEPFTQLDSSTTRAYGGSGLGLAISVLLAEGMGGRLWVDSQPGQGSTFSCAVPLDCRVRSNQAPDTIAALWPKAPSETGPLAPGSLLIVEDSAPNRLLYKIFLEQQPLGIQFATTGHEALQLAASRVFDAMVVDLQLPDINGLTVIREIRHQEVATGRPPTPILVVTALAFREERHQAFEDGADALLTKPIQKKQFLAMLGKLLRRDKSTSVSPAPDTWTTPPKAD